jgi:nucleotide-binding universal stress UspA family protein
MESTRDDELIDVRPMGMHSQEEKEMPMKKEQTESDHDWSELRIVVGVDGSECANLAVEFAAHEAARWGALLHIVGAYELAPDAGWVVVPLEPFEENAAASVRAAISRVFELEPDVVTKGETVHGVPGHVLVDVSKGASQLVIGSRGRGEVASLILGSVSEHCLHHVTHCPVTIVRTA